MSSNHIKQSEKRYLFFYTMFLALKSIFLLTLIALQARGNENSDCNHSGRSESYLDAAAQGLPKKTQIPANGLRRGRVLSGGRNNSGIFTIWPRSRLTNGRPLEVFCDMDTDGGGWTVIQRRGDFDRPKEFFFKDWASYKQGFENDNIYALTNQRLYSIRFDFQAVDGEKRYALYDIFWIDDERSKYAINIKDYSGNAGDSMNSIHDNQKFSTKDQDNDSHKDHHCALTYKGGWWYNACHDSNLNGLYHRGPHESNADGVNWKSFKGHKESLLISEMKTRPKEVCRKQTHLGFESPIWCRSDWSVKAL
ncbi:Techylectin-5A like protein [Argiope bruennichi]|uniref:Techylectin-5A like protein n=1 Tax=Argiope bruennichi TaxID=94029 RepID=A0A8T0EHZ5_ARGBR|nr:Techylectin-5A like protein [Argiope bruennichi]